MLNDPPTPVPRTWPHWASIAVGILVGSVGTAGALSMRACSADANQRQPTSPVQGTGGAAR